MASEFVTMTSPTKVYPVIQITLYIQPCDQSLVTLAFYTDLTRRTTFFERWSWFKLTNLGLTLGMTLKFYTSVTKGLKLIFGKFCGLSPTFVVVTGEKLVEGAFLPPPQPQS